MLLRLGRSLGARLCARDRSVTGWTTIFGRALDKTSNFFIIMVSARLVTHYAQAPAPLATTVNFLFTVAAVFQAAIWARELILGFIEHRTGAEGEHERLGSAMGIIRLLVTVALFAIALVVVLDNLGVNVTGLVAGLGIGGIAIGLAAQGIFSDLFAALSILFDKPFRRGEAIGYDQGSGGSVEAIGLKTTRLRSATGEEKIISNAKLLEKELINWTRMTYRRQKFAIGVVYQTPTDKLAQIPEMLRSIVEAEHQSFVRSGFVNFGPSSLDFELEFDAPSDFDEAYQARHRVGMAILKRFADEKIDFAYPTQTTFTAAPDGRMVMPYAEVQKVKEVDGA